MSQLTQVIGVDTALLDLCWNGLQQVSRRHTTNDKCVQSDKEISVKFLRQKKLDSKIDTGLLAISLLPFR